MSVSKPVTAMGLLLRVFIAGVCAPFVVSGVSKIFDLAGASRELASLGIAHPLAMALLVVAVQLGGSLLAIFHHGGWAALGAVLLAAFTVYATWLAHAFWTYQGVEYMSEMNIFFEHVSIVFALLMVAWGHAKSVEASHRTEPYSGSSTHSSSAVEY